jgi:tetratricopeptide (TPR) repeat protein
MLAVIDARLGRVKEAEAKLLVWVREHDTFNHWFIAAHFYHAAGQRAKCLAALRKAAESPLKELWAEWEETGEHFGSMSGETAARNAALLAYREKELDLCLTLCARWERYDKIEHGYGTLRYCVYQAACYLNRGEFTKAKAAIEEGFRSDVNYGFEFDKPILGLRKAIEAKEVHHRYEPRDSEDPKKPDEWKLLIPYK